MMILAFIGQLAILFKLVVEGLESSARAISEPTWYVPRRLGKRNHNVPSG